MLKVNCLTENDRLDFRFDLPVPEACRRNEQWRSLIDGIAGASSLRFSRNGREGLAGFSLDRREWIEYLQHTLPADESVFMEEVLADLFSAKSRPLGEGLQVNFHQKNYDTPERYWNFILNQGFFVRYFLNRVNWYLAPKNRIVTPFPLHVDLESASTCNMNCPMCYRRELKDTGHMDLALFKKAIEEGVAHNLFSVRLSWRGETLTHPRIKEMIAYAAARIPNVSFLTNAFYLDDDLMDCFIETGLSYLAVSFDGLAETYEKVRQPAKFQDSYNRLVRLREKKKAAGSLRPQVRVCTIWPAISADPEAYYRTMKDVADYVVYNPYINFRGPMTVKPDFICQYPWERMVVAYDGETQCCTGWNATDIILGNLKEKTLAEMWHSPLMNEIRRLHAEGRRLELVSCADCRHGSEGDPNANIEDILERRY
ncbi:MAG: radical SAM protein [Thermodesulfobacteriota bacterium]